MFLPDDYVEPASNQNYWKPKNGENKIRILSQAITGWEDWVNRKPERFRFHEKPLTSFDPEKPVKLFWSMIIFSYADEDVKIYHCDKATVRKAIGNLSNDHDWGAPYFYDLKITREGEDNKTKYSVAPSPKKPVDPYVIQCFNQKRCWLPALYDNKDPFDVSLREFTPGIFSEADYEKARASVGPKVEPISRVSKEEAAQLELILADCDRIWKDQVSKQLLKDFGTTDLTLISREAYVKLLAVAKTKIIKFDTGDGVPF